jgi:transcriptional regulator with XRE-family HTH domain
MDREVSRLYLAVGERLRELRTSRAGLTQERLAHLAGFDPAFVSRVERGRTAASLQTIGILCSALGISLADFFRPFHEPPALHGPRKRRSSAGR